MGIETKFNVGDVVYYATVARETLSAPCPDCKGERKWKAISPAGNEYTFTCPRCSTHYLSKSDLSLKYNVATPHVETITIGAIDYRSSGFGGGGPEVHYMRQPGGGTMYAEKNLFATHEEAMMHAKIKAATEDESWKARGIYWHGDPEVCDYQLDIAMHEAAENRLRDLHGKIENAAYRIKEAVEDKDDLLEVVAEELSKLGHEILEDA